MAQESQGTNEDLRAQAVERFIATSEDGSPLGNARNALYEAAAGELLLERRYAPQLRRESLVPALADRWRDGFVPERYQVCQWEQDVPAPDVRTGLLLLREPRNSLLGCFAIWLVLAREAQTIAPDRTVCIVLPKDSRLTRHHLAWLACMNEALGSAGPARLLLPTWGHDSFRFGLSHGEGYSLADAADGAVELEHLLDVATGERLALCLTRDGVARDGRPSYLLDLRAASDVYPWEPALSDVIGDWRSKDHVCGYGEGEAIEHLELDVTCGLLVAKFAGEHHLKCYDGWRQAWVVPSTVAIFGESGYDRAYYLGQGSWEDLSAFDAEHAGKLLGAGWLGDASPKSNPTDDVHIIGPDGTRRILGRFPVKDGLVAYEEPSPFLVWQERARAARLSEQREADLDKFEGCLVGGAVGDALGYPVEFMTYASILDTFGPAGIRAYWLAEGERSALFSDDTQMTLFTAAGLLEAETMSCVKGTDDALEGYINRAYLDWLQTQDESYTAFPMASHLVNVRPLHARRAPGNTCLSALYAGGMGTMAAPPNHSKGCGGVMRVAPVGLFAQRWFGDVHEDEVLRQVARAGAAAAALTHGHPLGYIPAGVLAVLVTLVTYRPDLTLGEAVELCARSLPSWFEDDLSAARDMAAQLRRAAELAANDATDHDNVVRLGEGWVGDEALAIAVYCCLRHPDSFDEAVIAAVNHGGDSDSTGAIAGNIMGAYLGIQAIGPQWTKRLELRDLIIGLARDLCDGCLMTPGGVWRPRTWIWKYALELLGERRYRLFRRG